MSEKMLKFVKIGQQNPPKRSTGERNKDFNEIRLFFQCLQKKPILILTEIFE